MRLPKFEYAGPIGRAKDNARGAGRNSNGRTCEVAAEPRDTFWK